MKYMNDTERMREWVSTSIGVESVNIQVVSTFNVLHHLWESDGFGWIVNDGNRNYVILTNHGMYHFAGTVELQSLLDTYKSVYDSTKQALELLGV
jgi:hypothetical protein